MKKILPLFLLCIFLFNTVGYYVAFKVAQVEIKREMKKEIKLNLNEDELTIIRFTRKEIKSIKWLEINKEFFYSDQLFDIVRIAEDESSVTLYCINDKQERKLFSTLEDQVLKHIQNNKNSNKNKTNSVKTDFFEEQDITCSIPNPSLLNESPYDCSAYSVSLSISTPPPRS